MFTNVNRGSQPTKQGVCPPSPTTLPPVVADARRAKRADFYRTLPLLATAALDASVARLGREQLGQLIEAQR